MVGSWREFASFEDCCVSSCNSWQDSTKAENKGRIPRSNADDDAERLDNDESLYFRVSLKRLELQVSYPRKTQPISRAIQCLLHGRTRIDAIRVEYISRHEHWSKHPATHDFDFWEDGAWLRPAKKQIVRSFRSSAAEEEMTFGAHKGRHSLGRDHPFV